MCTVAFARRCREAILAIICIALFAGNSDIVDPANAKSAKNRNQEGVSVSTYAPPTKSVNTWPRLVDAKRGLMAQHSRVRVQCLKPKLVAMLHRLEKKFGKKPIITSGYRSPAYNRRVRGAKRSKHMTCEAADIRIPGVSKWKLAKYVRSMPGRGGVGTYCRSSFIHIDISTKRDWNWGCRKKKRKRKS